jgi:hypothetical protein
MTCSDRSGQRSKPTRRSAASPCLTYGRPEASIEAVPGAPAIKSAMLTVTVDYEPDAPPS